LSRNRGRTGLGQTKKPENTTSPAQHLANNADEVPFSFVVPTEFVDLPSEGKYYPPGHPLHGQTSIEIKQMTAKEEDILTSRTLLKKGVALERVIQSVIIDKSIDPQSLLVGDRNAILVSIRVSGYGHEYTTSVTCPDCATNQDYSFDLNDTEIYRGEHDEDVEVIANEDGTFTTPLPRTGINVAFKLLNGYDEKRLTDGIEHDRKKKNDRLVTRQLRSMIVAVNEDSSKEVLDYLIENIPSRDSRHLRLAYQLVAPNLDLAQEFECSECDYSQKMEVPLGAEFFWPDR
jgi:hypothetical protein